MHMHSIQCFAGTYRFEPQVIQVVNDRRTFRVRFRTQPKAVLTVPGRLCPPAIAMSDFFTTRGLPAARGRRTAKLEGLYMHYAIIFYLPHLLSFARFHVQVNYRCMWVYDGGICGYTMEAYVISHQHSNFDIAIWCRFLMGILRRPLICAHLCAALLSFALRTRTIVRCFP